MIDSSIENLSYVNKNGTNLDICHILEIIVNFLNCYIIIQCSDISQFYSRKICLSARQSNRWIVYKVFVGDKTDVIERSTVKKKSLILRNKRRLNEDGITLGVALLRFLWKLQCHLSGTEKIVSWIRMWTRDK